MKMTFRTLSGDRHTVARDRGARSKTMISKLTLCLFSMFALSAKGFADAPLTRPCRSSDLNGIYVLAQYKEIGGQNFSRSASHFRYRFLELTPPGTWVEHSMNRMPANPALVEKMLGNDPKDRSYSLDAGARLVVKHGGQISFTGHCAVSLGERGGFHASDLILSGGLTNNPGELHELFRRWNGEPYPGAAADFDPAAAAAAAGAPSPGGQARVAPTAKLAANGPAPVRADVVTVGQNASAEISVVVTNLNRLPLSAFMVVYRNGATSGVWRDAFVDACVDHHAAWQPNQQWRRGFGMMVTVRQMEAYVGAAIFTDGSEWGDAKRLAKLKQHRGSCQWPGS
jgi:hypothetical protein